MKTRILITIDEDVLKALDKEVSKFSQNGRLRSTLINKILREKLGRKK